MLASLRGGNGLAGVLRMRRGEDDGIDVSIAQHVFVARGQFQSEARGQFTLAVQMARDHGGKADLAALALHGFDEPRAPMACSADCRTQHTSAPSLRAEANRTDREPSTVRAVFRGKVLVLDGAGRMLATIHPSFILRVR